MHEPAQRHRTTMAWSLPASLAVHSLLALAALLLVPRPLAPPAERSIAVDIVSPEQYAALLPAPVQPEPVVVQEPPAEPAPPQAPAADGMVEAHDFYAAAILDDPSNAELRDNFPLLASSEQIVQLCNIEALEQLRSSGAASDPDALVGYAFGGFAVDHDELRVDGGAFRSRSQWFHIRYRCTVMADMSGVRAFEYAVGDVVPPSQWEEHFLNADDDWLN